MRDPKRIDVILTQISNIWHANPDLRLGQLICNFIPENMLYYVEDDKLIETLKNGYKSK